VFRTKGLLVIVPCGKGKIWKKHPSLGGVQAKDVYTGPPFKKNREYAEKFAEKWVILSAKYGYIEPSFIIPADYNVTFKDITTEPIDFNILKRQVERQDLANFDLVIGLGGKEYREAILASFPNRSNLQFPFRGLSLGKAMSAIDSAIQKNNPLPDPSIV